jgi:hypothetical protein
MIPSFKHGIIASSRPRVVVAGGGGGDFTAGEFDFTDVNVDTDQAGQTNTVTFTHSGTITIYSEGASENGGEIRKNGVAQTVWLTQEGAETNGLDTGVWVYNAFYSKFSVSSGDTLYFYFNADPSPPENSIITTIRNSTFSGTIIDTFTWFKSGCFLTTSVVKYMNLRDNGPELTAMRALREHYRNVPGYQEIISEYYQNSPAIIRAINALTDPSVEYQYIYNTVIAVKHHVDMEEWQQAHDLYMAMYNDLKSRYLGN